MKRQIIFILTLLTILSCNSSVSKSNKFKDGDIVFHISQSSQSNAIKHATHSKYTHIGIIFNKDNVPFVLEAVQPVKYTKLSKWIDHGKDSHYILKRLKNRNSLLTNEILNQMKTEGEYFLNNDYDIYFNWSDDELYCSELVWKIYNRAAKIELCQLNKLKEYDLSHREVKNIMKKRYGNNLPLEELMVSPQDIFDSELLITIE